MRSLCTAWVWQALQEGVVPTRPSGFLCVVARVLCYACVWQALALPGRLVLLNMQWVHACRAERLYRTCAQQDVKLGAAPSALVSQLYLRGLACGLRVASTAGKPCCLACGGSLSVNVLSVCCLHVASTVGRLSATHGSTQESVSFLCTACE